MSVNLSFRSISVELSNAVHDDPALGTSLLEAFPCDAEGHRALALVNAKPKHVMLARFASAIRKRGEALESRDFRVEALGMLLQLRHGFAALDQWSHAGGPNLVEDVLSQGAELDAPMPYDPARLQSADDVAAISAKLMALKQALGSLPVGPDHAPALFFVGELNAFYAGALHRGHDVIVASV